LLLRAAAFQALHCDHLSATRKENRSSHVSDQAHAKIQLHSVAIAFVLQLEARNGSAIVS
jgi:hypothetical protein